MPPHLRPMVHPILRPVYARNPMHSRFLALSQAAWHCLLAAAQMSMSVCQRVDSVIQRGFRDSMLQYAVWRVYLARIRDASGARFSSFPVARRDGQSASTRGGFTDSQDIWVRTDAPLETLKWRRKEHSQ